MKKTNEKMASEKWPDDYQQHLRRGEVVKEFLGEFKVTKYTLPKPREGLVAILVTFMEWLEEKTMAGGKN